MACRRSTCPPVRPQALGLGGVAGQRGLGGGRSASCSAARSAARRAWRRPARPGPERARDDRGKRRLRLADLGAPHLELVAPRRELGELLLGMPGALVGAQALVLDPSFLQLRKVLLELHPLLFEASDLLLELRLRRGGLAVPALG